MKQLILFLFAACSLQSAWAQKNAIKIGPVYGFVPYFYGFTTGGEVQYDRLILPYATFSTTLGHYRQNSTASWFFYSSDASGIRTSSYTFPTKASVNYLDALIQAHFVVGKRINLKPGCGLTAAHIVTDGPLKLVLNHGWLTDQTIDKHRATAAMFCTVMESEILLGKHFSIGIKGGLRIKLSTNGQPRTVTIQTETATTTEKDTFWALSTASARIGYRF